MSVVLFFFNDTATTEIYTLSLHDALPISRRLLSGGVRRAVALAAEQEGASDGLFFTAADVADPVGRRRGAARRRRIRSEEHTSELQSHQYLVCRLLLEKKKLDVSTAGMQC